MSTITDWMQGCAAVFGVGIALVAAWYARSQIKAGLAASREASAMDAYRSYLALCIERPELSSSKLYLDGAKEKTFKGITAQLTQESERYLWFVSNLLNTGEQIVEHVDGREHWRHVISEQVSFHAPVLLEAWPKWEEGYGEAMCAIVDQVLEEYKAKLAKRTAAGS